jgi:pantoate--beta-alanine ligase
MTTLSPQSVASLPVAQSRAELAAARKALTGPVSVVMTMGALHAGHAALIRAAAGYGRVIVTIFVNPLQFGPNEDLERYPRTLGADLELCAAAGADLVFAPTPEVMYPNGQPLVRLDPGPGGAVLEGASRPGHFAGVLTVVNKLLNLTRPDFALFGEKDFQQLTLIRQMVRDLDMPVEIVGVPTWRDDAGLALSSRNRYLSTEQGPTALTLSQALAAGSAVAAQGRDAVLAAARGVLTSALGLSIDRLDLVDPDTLADAVHGPARLLVAAILPGPSGPIRLIDNAALILPPLPNGMV